MRARRRPSRSLAARGLCKVTIIAPELTAEGFRQFARELCERHEAGPTYVDREWRRLSVSAELLVDPRRGGRCAIQDTRKPKADRYRWTLAVLGEPHPMTEGGTSDIATARSEAEVALDTYLAWRVLPSDLGEELEPLANGPWRASSDADG
jgi:hypothetical protein